MCVNTCKKCHLDRFENDEGKTKISNAEVKGFNVEGGLSGHTCTCSLVNEVLFKLESIVNEVAKREVGKR